MDPGKTKAARCAEHLSGPETADQQQRREDTTSTGDHCKRQPGPLRLMESEAATLERGADILARSPLTDSPAVEQLGRALELLLRREAERTRYKLRNGRSMAELFPDRKTAEATA